MDLNLRNFRDYLEAYNKVTELCFSSCIDNLFSRNLSIDETSCVEHCATKYKNVNNKLFSVYIEVQSTINEKRLIETEELNRQKLQNQQTTIVDSVVSPGTTTSSTITT